MAEVFSSVRLKNTPPRDRGRGVHRAGASRVSGQARDIVRHVVRPLALGLAGRRASWPERGATWLDARAALAHLIEEDAPSAVSERDVGVRRQETDGTSAGDAAAVLFVGSAMILCAKRARRRVPN